MRTYTFHLSLLCLSLIALSSATTQGQQSQQDIVNDPGNFSAFYALANSSSANKANDPPLMRPSPSLIVRKFIDAETNFRKALIHFSFKRDVILQTIGPSEAVTGEYLRDSVFALDDRGQRLERVLYHPRPTMREMTITKEDIEDLAGSQLFGLEMADSSSYNFSYLGEVSLKGRPMYLLEVSPRKEPDPRQMRLRFFVGRIWVDQVSFQATLLRGTTEPHGKQRFPVFETERNLSVENLPFPSSTFADDVLRFPDRDVRYRVKVRYYDFKRFASRVKIVEAN